VVVVVVVMLRRDKGFPRAERQQNHVVSQDDWKHDCNGCNLFVI
jgi:hypothetical protein